MAHIPYGGDLIGRSPTITSADIELNKHHRTTHAAIARVSASLTHVLNNQLTVTIGFVERAKALATNNLQSRTLEQAHSGAENMVRALHRLQDFARVDDAHGQTSCIKAALDDALAILGNQSAGSEVIVSIDEPHRIKGEMQDVSRMLVILLSNALESGSVEPVRVRVRDITAQNHPLDILDGDYLVVTVSDTGRGMEHGELQRLFEPFYSTKTGRPGTSLSWLWNFVTKNGGTIRVRSEPNKGSSFEVYMPFGQGIPPRTQAPVVRLHPRTKKSVLIIEDKVEILDIVHTAMTNLGLDIVTAKSSSEALQYVTSKEFDLIISDITIPGELNGSDIADIALEHYPCTNILLTSGRLDRENLMVNPEYQILSKPFSMAKLTRTVAAILK